MCGQTRVRGTRSDIAKDAVRNVISMLSCDPSAFITFHSELVINFADTRRLLREGFNRSEGQRLVAHDPAANGGVIWVSLPLFP